MSGGPTSAPEPDGRSRRRLETTAHSEADIPLARRAAVEHLRHCGCDNIDDVALVLSEMITNAVIHAGGAEHIMIDCNTASVTINVRDDAPEPPRIRHDATVGGRGLRIVAQLTTEWGSTPHLHGKNVWAILPYSTASPRRHT